LPYLDFLEPIYTLKKLLGSFASRLPKVQNSAQSTLSSSTAQSSTSQSTASQLSVPQLLATQTQVAQSNVAQVTGNAWGRLIPQVPDVRIQSRYLINRMNLIMTDNGFNSLVNEFFVAIIVL
jgi:hypothetical protein